MDPTKIALKMLGGWCAITHTHIYCCQLPQNDAQEPIYHHFHLRRLEAISPLPFKYYPSPFCPWVCKNWWRFQQLASVNYILFCIITAVKFQDEIFSGSNSKYLVKFIQILQIMRSLIWINSATIKPLICCIHRFLPWYHNCS